jgi:hypothetical protein
VTKPKNFGLVVDHAQVAALSELEINIIIVLAIYFALNLAILVLVHILTRKYNDK